MRVTTTVRKQDGSEVSLVLILYSDGAKLLAQRGTTGPLSARDKIGLLSTLLSDSAGRWQITTQLHTASPRLTGQFRREMDSDIAGLESDGYTVETATPDTRLPTSDNPPD